MTEAEAKGMVEAKLRCMELEGLSCVEKGCDRDCDACKYNYLQGTVGEHKEALRIAINALEKQVPKKIIYRRQNYGTPYLCCECEADQTPTEFFHEDGSEPKEKHTYCWKCGQKLDWGEVR